MQLDGEGDGGGEDEDGLQEGEKVADAPEQGGAMPEAEPQERQPQPAEGGDTTFHVTARLQATLTCLQRTNLG